MTAQELDEIIDWCRNKLVAEKKKPIGFRLTTKELSGYEQAIKAVMSYLHCQKDRVE